MQCNSACKHFPSAKMKVFGKQIFGIFITFSIPSYLSSPACQLVQCLFCSCFHVLDHFKRLSLVWYSSPHHQHLICLLFLICFWYYAINPCPDCNWHNLASFAFQAFVTMLFSPISVNYPSNYISTWPHHFYFLLVFYTLYLSSPLSYISKRTWTKLCQGILCLGKLSFILISHFCGLLVYIFIPMNSLIYMQLPILYRNCC